MAMAMMTMMTMPPFALIAKGASGRASERRARRRQRVHERASGDAAAARVGERGAPAASRERGPSGDGGEFHITPPAALGIGAFKLLGRIFARSHTNVFTSKARLAY